MEQLKQSFYLVNTGILNETSSYPERLLYATRTGAVLLIRDNDYQAFRNNHFHLLPQPVYDQLVDIEALVPSSQNELDFLTSENKDAIAKNKTLDIVIQPGASCQLGCHYCGQEHTSKYMDKALQEKVLNRVCYKLDEMQPEKLEVTWYGAEPLMAVNHIRDLSDNLISISKAYGIDYVAQMVTNGVSLKPKIFLDMVTKCKVMHYQITLDGTAEYHDKNRYTKKGQLPTFSIIFKNILDIVNDPGFKDLGATIMIRCNVDLNNVDGLEEFIDYLAGHELQDKIGFYVIPIHNWGDNKAEELTGVEKNGFAAQEIDWMIKLMDLGFDVDILPTRTKIVCSAVKQHSEVYDAYGTVSSCWEVPYTPMFKNTDFEIGNVNIPFKENVTTTPMRDWNDDIKKGETWCMKCNLLPVCGGSCPIHWESGTPACPSFKFNIEDRVVLEYVKRKQLVLS